MQNTFSNALSEATSEHIPPPATRRKTLAIGVRQPVGRPRTLRPFRLFEPALCQGRVVGLFEKAARPMLEFLPDPPLGQKAADLRQGLAHAVARSFHDIGSARATPCRSPRRSGVPPDARRSRKLPRCGLTAGAARYRSHSILLRRFVRNRGCICRPFRSERLPSLLGPERSRMFSLLALELVGHPKQRAVDHSAIIAGQVHDPGLDDEPAEFDQMPGALAALDLPCAHVMPRQHRLMPVARRPVALEGRQRRAQMSKQIAANGFGKTWHRASPMPPSSRRPWFQSARPARPPVRRRSARRLRSRSPTRRVAAPCDSSSLAPCPQAPSVPHRSLSVCASSSPWVVSGAMIVSQRPKCCKVAGTAWNGADHPEKFISRARLYVVPTCA